MKEYFWKFKEIAGDNGKTIALWGEEVTERACMVLLVPELIVSAVICIGLGIAATVLYYEVRK